MKSEIQNLIEIKESELLKTHSLVKSKKGETFKENDVMVIYDIKGNLTCVKLSAASYLVRKHLDIFPAILIYRKK